MRDVYVSVKGMRALISEAACLLYGFLCLYDLILAFWPHHDTAVEFAAPRGLCNRSCGLPSPKLTIFFLEDIRKNFLKLNTDRLEHGF